MNLLNISNYTEYIEFEFGESISESLTVTIYKNDPTYSVDIAITNNLSFNYDDVQQSVKKARELFHFIINQQG